MFLAFAFIVSQNKGIQQILMGAVAPHVGAWIETHLQIYKCEAGAVAPHVGAWIAPSLCIPGYEG